MKGRVFWMQDPEADAIKSPFVRQPHYNDLENRCAALEGIAAELAAVRDDRQDLADRRGEFVDRLYAQESRIATLEGIADARMQRITELERALESIQTMRLNWAMVCPCPCLECDIFYENVRDILPESTAETLVVSREEEAANIAREEMAIAKFRAAQAETSVQPKVPAHRERPHDYESPTCWCGEHNYQSKIRGEQ